MLNKIRYGALNWSVEDKKIYRSFTHAEEAKRWGSEHYGNWASQYKKSMQSAKQRIETSYVTAPIETYYGYLYRQMNDYLRFNRKDENNLMREVSDVLSIVISSAPEIPENIILYRLVNDECTNKLVEGNKRGTPFQEKGFMSTSLLQEIIKVDEAYAGERNVLKIYVDKGTTGIYVNEVTKRQEEEILLPPNMYLALTSYPYKDKMFGKIVYECRLIDFNF